MLRIRGPRGHNQSTFKAKDTYSMRHWLRLFTGILALAAPILAHAETPAAAVACQGTDMIAEMASKDAELYNSIIADAKKLENTESLLWKVEKPGQAPSYLFGTVHLSDERVTVLSDKVKGALHTSKQLAVEVADLSQEAVTKAMANAAGLLIYTDGQTLSSKLTAAEFKQVEAVLSKSGLPGDMAPLLRPWLVSMLMAISDCERKRVEAGITVLDMKLAEEAKKDSIAIIGLETIEQQLGSLAEVPDDQQIQMLKSGLQFADRTEDMIETMVQLYLKRQMGAAVPFQMALAAKSGTPAAAYEGFQKSLLVDRNARMKDKVIPLIDKGGAFVAVGALHLPGKTGLVAGLRDAGYTITAAD